VIRMGVCGAHVNPCNAVRQTSCSNVAGGVILQLSLHGLETLRDLARYRALDRMRHLVTRWLTLRPPCSQDSMYIYMSALSRTVRSLCQGVALEVEPVLLPRTRYIERSAMSRA